MVATQPLQILDITPWSDENRAILSNYIRNNFSGKIKVLDAGCGQETDLDLQGLDYELTGLDPCSDVFEIRKDKYNKLDKMVVGDLQSVEFPKGEYHVIYSSYVLEHVDGAEKVLDNFVEWVKPKGVILLRIPDPKTVYGFLAKNLPFWAHVLYKKYVHGIKKAGQPGYAPFPTFYDRVVCRRGIEEYCQKKGLKIKMEYSYTLKDTSNMFKTIPALGGIILKTVELISLGQLESNRNDLVFIIEKPE